eukprot:jgi/Tetstr1/433913/TSEL_023093.t1
MVRTRDLLLLGLLVVGLRLLSVGDARPPRDRGGQLEATSGGREHASGAATAAARRGGGRGEAHSGRGRRADPEADIVQVEVMEEDMQEAEVGEAVSLAGEELPEGSGLAAVEEAGEGSWEEGDTAGSGKWVGMLRPDMEFLVSKQSITATSSGGGHKPMVTFAFKDHKGSVRKLEWEADFADATHLPDYDWRWTSSVDVRAAGAKQRHATCALVGNSGIMRNSKMGQEIDSHEAVLRINYAPTRGFEADVGSKTTYDLLNKENCMKLTKGEHKWRRPKSTVFLFESHSRIIRAQVYSKFFSRAALRSGDETALVLQPALMTTSRTIYLAIKAEAEDEINALRLNWGSTGQLNRTKLHRMSTYMASAVQRAGPMQQGRRRFEFNGKPMSGMAALFLCIQMCERTTMYGFAAFLDKRKQHYHYFDDREGMTEVHSFDLAMEVFRRVGEHYPVTVREMGRLR